MSQGTILFTAGTCDGILSASWSPQGSQVCPFKVPETLCICTKDSVLTAPLQNRPPRSRPALLRVVQSADCTVRCKHRLSIKTSSPQPQTGGSALWSGRNRHWREPRPEETSAFPWANLDPEKQLHSVCTMDLTPQTNLYNLIMSNHIHGTRLTG